MAPLRQKSGPATNIKCLNLYGELQADFQTAGVEMEKASELDF